MRTLNNKIASAFFALTACMAMAFGFLACSNDSEPPVVIVVPDNQTKNGETKTDGETNAPVANPAIYTITFNANDGSENPATAAQTFTAGMPQNLKTIASLGFARDGFYFAGWLTAADGAEACWSDGAAYTAVTDATLYAKWSAIPVYKVNVPVNERGEIVATPATARAGTEITLLVTPFAGYKFESLSVTGADSKAIAVTDGKFTMPAQDVTVEADFSAISYTISCGTFAEGLVSADIDTATIGTEVTLLAKPNDGYKFASYSVVAADGSDVSVVDGKFKMPAGNVNVYAVFTAETYMITFDANGGSANSAAASQTFKARNSQALKKVEELGFSRDGYTFAGWLTEIGAEDASYADGASYTATADATLYAKWSAIPIYNVNVPVNERGDVSASPATARAGTKIALTASPKAGYQFAYYTVTDADNKVVSVLNGEFTMPDKNVTVAATFNAIDYRVSVGSFEHGTVKASPSIATVGTEITLTATPKTGYKLGSYTVTDADSNSVLVTDGKFKMPAKDVSVSAAFNAIDYSVTVGSVSNGTVTISAKKATYGTEITLGATPKEGYKFVSYSVTGADGSQVQVEDGKFAMPAQNVMVSATFAAINYTISIGQFEHGTVTASPATATVGTKITLSNTPNEGYKFGSYTVTAADGTAVTVADGKFTMPASNVMVAATFVAKNSGMLKVPLTLEAVEAGAKVTFKNMAAGPVTYKVNGGAAQTIASEATGTITLENEGDKVAFYGDNETYTIKYNRSYNSSKIACDKDCYVYGNIMSLVKSGSFAAADTLSESYIFQKLFSNNTHIKNKDGAELLLPATTLVEYCYDGMFEGCVSLTRAPELPATTLADKCYESMFSGCTNLTSAPELPATTLAERCYDSMFRGCTNLTSAPALPATTLSKNCYMYMFSGCSSLTSAPALPATTLAESCYDSMFRGCTNLTSAPELPATTLAESCYGSMFYGCKSLTSAPALPATTLSKRCYREMFYGCSSLTSAPALPTTTLAEGCYGSMFSGCTNLTSAPELPATTLAIFCYSGMFSGCKGLTSAPALPATTLAERCYNSMFDGCTNLTSAPWLYKPDERAGASGHDAGVELLRKHVLWLREPNERARSSGHDACG